MAILADASAASLHRFVADNVEPGATVVTDAWQGYRGLEGLGYTHDRHSQRAARARGDDPGELLPGVHRVAALAKRWLLGTHRGSVEPTQLESYLNEFTFRFNRRRSRSRGMVFYRVLELAVGHAPVRYRDLVVHPQPRRSDPSRPHAAAIHRPGPPTSGATLASRRTALLRSAEYRSAEYPNDAYERAEAPLSRCQAVREVSSRRRTRGRP